MIKNTNVHIHYKIKSQKKMTNIYGHEYLKQTEGFSDIQVKGQLIDQMR